MKNYKSQNIRQAKAMLSIQKQAFQIANKKEVIQMASSLAREKAAQAWCQPSTEKLGMIPELAEAFAEILDEVWSKPWLGNATNLQLIEELHIRHQLGHTTPDYKSTK